MRFFLGGPDSSSDVSVVIASADEQVPHPAPQSVSLIPHCYLHLRWNRCLLTVYMHTHTLMHSVRPPNTLHACTHTHAHTHTHMHALTHVHVHTHTHVHMHTHTHTYATHTHKHAERVCMYTPITHVRTPLPTPTFMHVKPK